MKRTYFDYAASTPCDPRVIEVMQPLFFEQSGNASSPHESGRRSRKAIESSREIMAQFLGALADEIVFTSGATESNNHVVFSCARALKSKGQHIVSSAIEHHSVLEALKRLEQDGFSVTYVNPQPDGIVAVKDIEAALKSDTILVCLHHANNEIGTLQPIEETGKLCRMKGIYFLVDATQTVGHLPVNVKDLSCDFLSLSAHKFYGPQGIGALYIRKGIELPAFILGGDQERSRRAGTHNASGIAGMGQAIQLCQAQMIQAAENEIKMRNHIIEAVLEHIPGSRLNGHPCKRLPNNAHFSFEAINGEELVSVLDMAGFSVSMGSACTWGQLEPSHVLKAIGLTDAQALGSLRISLGRFNTEDDIPYLIEQLTAKVKQLRVR